MKKSITAIAMILITAVLASSLAGAAAPKKKPAVKQPSPQTVKWGKALCDKADKALAKNDYEKARDIYSQVLWKLPSSPRAKSGLKKAEAAIRGQQNKARQEALNAVRSGKAKANERLQTDKKVREEAGIIDGIVWQPDLNQGMVMARHYGKFVVINCTGADYPACVKMNSETWTNAQVIALARSFVSIKISDEDKTALQTLNVNSYPTIIFCDPMGTEIKRISDFRSPQQMLSEMNEVLNGGQMPAVQQ